MLECSTCLHYVEAVNHGGFIGHPSRPEETPLTTKEQADLRNGITTTQNVSESVALSHTTPEDAVET